MVDVFQADVIYPPVGSVLDTANFRNGFENVYTDLVGEGQNGTNLITDMFNRPFGDGRPL